MVNFIETTIPNDQDGRRFDRFLRQFFANLSQTEIEKLLRSKMIRLNGQKAKPDMRIHTDYIVRYPDFLILQTSDTSLNKHNIEFPKEIILYEDNDLMVINKPHGLAVQGGSNTKIHLDMMLDSLPKRNGYRPSSVHRLDKDTSGCLLIAKKPSIAAKLGEALKNREFEKYYLAITEAIPNHNGGIIQNYLVKSNTKNHDLMQITAKETPNASYAESLYYVITQNPSHNKALLLLSPITGRTHQLRVHCAFLNSPIIGDGKYNNLVKNFKKLCLHATKLIFIHPITHNKIEIDAPLPEHFTKIAHQYQLSLNNPISYDNREVLHLFKDSKFEAHK